ncbi:hypothetical protein M378DRAFT_813415 [Amanita muscaria Koide BX008]|uniref:Uncharacterized protein n=1 Tax=Amanita muscaria (strain Koide BX008) TaxID=946122 RepID=A0A0C2WZR0_AMAMK|nr:hypothetical protein M378DRAFT_813415 [Amanita muscaria Koide BX008]
MPSNSTASSTEPTTTGYNNTTTATSTPIPTANSTTSSPSINSQFTWVATETSLAVAATSSPTATFSLTNPDAPTTTVSNIVGNPTSVVVNPPPLPSGIPWRIYPKDSQTGMGGEIPNFTLISILFNQELNWPFVVANSLSSSQIFAWVPVLITTALGIPSDQVMTFALQVYVPSQYQGPQDASLLGTVWLGYIPTSDVSSLAVQIKVPQSAFYIGSSSSVARALAQRVVPAFSILSVPASSTGSGSNNNSSNNGSNARQDAIIGVVSALGAIAVLVLLFLVYRSIMRKREMAHQRLADAPPVMTGVAPQGREFDQDSVGGARRRSFYWAEDSLRGYQPESVDDPLITSASGSAGITRRTVAPTAISAPILRESSMNW